MAITGILLFGRLRQAERSFCRDAEDGANSVTGVTQATNARVLLVIVVGSFISRFGLSLAILLLCPMVFGSPLLSSPSRGLLVGRRTIYCPMPHADGQASHASHHGDLLMFWIAGDDPLVGHLFFLVGSHSGPGCLAENFANTRRALTRDVAFAVVAITTFVARRSQAQVGALGQAGVRY
jgi:hypothetical protein